MSIFYIDAPCAIKPFKKHDLLKEDTLDYIDHDMRKSNLKSETMNILSDWGSTYKSKGDKKYWEVIRESIHEHMHDVLINDFGYVWFEVGNYWYQQYIEGGKHGWHVHMRTMFTSVYYLEYPEGSPPTEFMNSITKQVFALDEIKEGDILTFPSYVVHRATENKTKNRKTILSWHSETECGNSYATSQT
tara:strand:- start:21 stop:587 length:567 start_codon:yes stop_codon:yes gene_type:complete